MNIKKNRYALVIVYFLLAIILPHSLKGQEPELIKENMRAKAQVVDKNTIKLRWAPTSSRIWLEGKKYGYRVERYTLIIDSVYQEQPSTIILGESIKPAPLNNWEKQALKSDYAAVIAQAFYGDEFELTSSTSDAGSIINQANELQQRFATSVFMAEYDYKAAKLAGWAYTDRTIKTNEQYLYRIILNRPKKQVGDTTAVFISYADKRELPKPIELNAVWGDRSVMLSWNYELLSPTYHSYYVERMSDVNKSFERITDRAVTALSENMSSLFFTDSLDRNDLQYSYRIIGVTSFDEEGIPSDTITGQGKKIINCIPTIFSGYFTGQDTAHVFWEAECESLDQIYKYTIKRAETPEGEYKVIKDNIPPHLKDAELSLKENTNYIKVVAINKDSTEVSSFPYALHQIDSIPPKIPVGLQVDIDSVGVAYVRWDANQETDLRGYRVLRSFSENGEKSTITSDFRTDPYIFDTLSMSLGNKKVYYSVSALDLRYNESEPCATVVAEKPNNASLVLPRITDYKLLEDGKVDISWYVDSLNSNIKYTLVRLSDKEEIVFESDSLINSFADKVPHSGEYVYWVVAKATDGKQAVSPQKITVSVTVSKEAKGVSNFTAYINERDGYVELSWKKHPQATFYRIYKKEDEQPMFLWKELDNSQDRVVDESVSADTHYSYTIIFMMESGRMSQAKTIEVNY